MIKRIKTKRYVSCKMKRKKKFMEFLKMKNTISTELISYVFKNKTGTMIVDLYYDNRLE